MSKDMSKDYIQTALSVVERSAKTIIGSVDEEGYPNLKAMLKPREHDGVKVFILRRIRPQCECGNICRIRRRRFISMTRGSFAA